MRLESVSRRAVPGSRVAGFGSTGNTAFVSRDGRTAFVYVFAPRSDDPFGANVEVQRDLRKALRSSTVGGAPVRVSGYDALVDSTGDADSGTGVLLEALIGGVGALLILIFVFGSWLALVPLGMAISSVLVSFLLLWGLTAITEVSPVVQFLVALIGLGVSIDYALLIVVRWREEREKGLDNEEAVIAAMGTAGRAVVFSGTTVAVGLVALIALPLPFLRSMGYGGMLIPLVATLVALTLLPVILASVGPKLDRKRIRRRDKSQTFWQRWAETVVRRRWLAAFLSIGILVVLLGAATNLQLGNADPDTIAKAGPAKKGLDALDDSGIGKGAIYPVETLVSEGDADKVRAAQLGVENVHGAAAPPGADWRRDGFAVVAAVPREGDDTADGRDAVQRLIAVAHDASPQARVGGSGPLNADFIDAVYGSFPLMIGHVPPARAGVPLDPAPAQGDRAERPLGGRRLGSHAARMAGGPRVGGDLGDRRHGLDQLMDPDDRLCVPLRALDGLRGVHPRTHARGVRQGRRHRRRRDIWPCPHGSAGHERRPDPVPGLAALASGPETDVKVLATGLAAGILIDATVIRALLVPAAISLFGRWNWWLPSGAARLLRVRPSPDPLPEPSGA